MLPLVRAASRVLGVVTALTVFTVSCPPALAAAPADSEADLGAMWREASTLMETAQYPDAIEKLTTLYAAIASDPDAHALRLRVRWSLHLAHIKTYERDSDREHLLISRDLLADYVGELADGEADLRADADAALTDVEAKLARTEPKDDPGPAAPVGPEGSADSNPGADPQEDSAAEPQSVAQPHAGRGLVFTGGVLGGLALVAAGIGLGGYVKANNAVGAFEDDPAMPLTDAQDEVGSGNALGTAFIVTGGVLAVTSIVLIAVGAKKRKAALSPTMSRTGGGLAIGGAF
jgi:hypothetical protein